MIFSVFANLGRIMRRSAMILMQRNTIIFSLAAFCALTLSGCYQAHSDDDLHTVPTTNNPHIIGSNSPVRSVPGAGF